MTEKIINSSPPMKTTIPADQDVPEASLKDLMNLEKDVRELGTTKYADSADSTYGFYLLMNFRKKLKKEQKLRKVQRLKKQQVQLNEFATCTLQYICSRNQDLSDHPNYIKLQLSTRVALVKYIRHQKGEDILDEEQFDCIISNLNHLIEEGWIDHLDPKLPKERVTPFPNHKVVVQTCLLNLANSDQKTVKSALVKLYTELLIPSVSKETFYEINLPELCGRLQSSIMEDADFREYIAGYLRAIFKYE